MLKKSCFLLCVSFILALIVQASEWKTFWATSVHGPYPVGFPTAQPELKDVFPNPGQGAVDQTFRLLIRPTIWENTARICLSNVSGAKPLTINGVFVGLHQASASVTEGSNQSVTFVSRYSVTIPPGESVWSDGCQAQSLKRLHP
jgi:hypothetical protein